MGVFSKHLIWQKWACLHGICTYSSAVFHQELASHPGSRASGDHVESLTLQAHAVFPEHPGTQAG